MLKRFTHLFTILAMLCLGSGMSQALHLAVAHAPHAPAAADSCSGHCGSIPPSTPGDTDSHPSHDDSDCAVCATLASTKSLVPPVISTVHLFTPASTTVAPAESQVPASLSLRVLRSRAPPLT